MDTPTTATRENQQQSLTNEASSDAMQSTSMNSKHTPTKPNDATTPRLGVCEVCAAKPACYCCPKCEVKTCCLDCSQIHKRELNCDGIRDRTKFIPLNCMTKQDFMSDYYFLEECTRYTEHRKYDRIKSYTRRLEKEMPLHVQRLLRAAYKRRIRLVKSLPHFTRYKTNTSVFNWKQHKIMWRVEWIFINAIKTTKTPNDVNINNDDVASASFVRYFDKRCDEQETLGALLDKYINNKLEYKELNYYQSAGLSALKLFLRAERLPNANYQKKQYFELDISKSLRANLAHKTILEFPSIYVSYEQNPAGFDVIIDNDDELDYKKKCYSQIDRLLQRPKLKRESNKISNETHANKDEHNDEDATTSASAVKKMTTTQTKPTNFLFYQNDEDNKDQETTDIATVDDNED